MAEASAALAALGDRKESIYRLHTRVDSVASASETQLDSTRELVRKAQAEHGPPPNYQQSWSQVLCDCCPCYHTGYDSDDDEEDYEASDAKTRRYSVIDTTPR